MPLKGHHHAAESIEKMKGNKNAVGTICSPELREKRRVRMLGKCGEKNPSWKGGKISLRGYLRIFTPSHPFANKQGYVFEHRLVMEAHLGRTLLPTEIVHHINGDVSDNRIENLSLFSSNREHIKNHRARKR